MCDIECQKINEDYPTIVEEKEIAKQEYSKDIINAIWTCDPKKQAWDDIIDAMSNSDHPVEIGLPLIFEYYETYNKEMGPWLNYLLSLSYFSDEELNKPTCRNAKRRLQANVTKLLKKRQHDPSTPIDVFLQKNSDLLK